MRSAGWEHVVASPNAERAWALDTLADLSDLTGASLPADDLRASAQQIRAEVIRQLWDADAGWFRSRYPDGHTELTYSIQAFDVLRSGACPPDVAAALISHLRPGAFLGEYGVSSVSAEDELHYETADIDWSGAGAYTGEGPQLALTLWDRGEPRPRLGRPAPPSLDGRPLPLLSAGPLLRQTRCPRHRPAHQHHRRPDRRRSHPHRPGRHPPAPRRLPSHHPATRCRRHH